MDVAAGGGAIQRALDTFKSAPLWILVGLCISLLAIWLWPPFLASLPEQVRSSAPIALVVAAILTC
jgi:hypothetical protein